MNLVSEGVAVETKKPRVVTSLLAQPWLPGVVWVNAD